ncbi:MAG: eukaryotic-like serine/threonine-protein kinase [Myxococcales bacterium]|nr:eukaryotic-like serine/threonine-protein kinase [Myxococcales bacterium]
MTAVPLQASLVGAILSRKYSLKRLIGTGGMGSVYEAQSLANESQPNLIVAIKVLAIDFLTDEDIKNRFVEEGRMCQRLIHPNIVRVFDVGTAEDGTPYIVMEMLDGVPLSAYTRSGGRVPLAQAGIILQGILAGLGAAHAQGIVHRDLKPENVFLAREPNGAFTAKILDFGIAKVMDAAGGMGNKTRTGVLLGTPAYMSPEQIKNAKDVDARADLWSAGVMLYEMLTGRVAFPAPTEYARLAAVLNTSPPPLEQVDPQLSRLSSFVQLSMQKDRAQRFQTGLEMARALSAALGAEGAVPTAGLPLSRLPDVPSMYLPMRPSSAPGQSPSPMTMQTPGPPMTSGSQPPPDLDVGPGGTLASPRTGARSVTDPPPQVVMVGGSGASHGTLPSENLPMFSAHGLSRRGVVPWLVIVLVVGALVAGFLLGYATARAH